MDTEGETIINSPKGCDSSPPSWKVRPRALETEGWTEGDLGGGQRSGCGMVTRAGRKAGRQILEEVRAEDGHPGGG